MRVWKHGWAVSLGQPVCQWYVHLLLSGLPGGLVCPVLPIWLGLLPSGLGYLVLRTWHDRLLPRRLGSRLSPLLPNWRGLLQRRNRGPYPRLLPTRVHLLPVGLACPLRPTWHEWLRLTLY